MSSNFCFGCRSFCTEECNRDHFPSDPACEKFTAVKYPSRKQQSFYRLSAKLFEMSDEELIRETKIRCRLFLLNTYGGQYLSEAIRRLAYKGVEK